LEAEQVDEGQGQEKNITDTTKRMEELEAKQDASNDQLEAKIDDSQLRLEAIF
jgi:hypothetical protein